MHTQIRRAMNSGLKPTGQAPSSGGLHSVTSTNEVHDDYARSRRIELENSGWVRTGEVVVHL